MVKTLMRERAPTASLLRTSVNAPIQNARAGLSPRSRATGIRMYTRHERLLIAVATVLAIVATGASLAAAAGLFADGGRRYTTLTPYFVTPSAHGATLGEANAEISADAWRAYTAVMRRDQFRHRVR